ncbi:MAG TPA: hypothetical protein VHO90_04775, partial [Bacteroidales bacterium]|nr:hypothetical protein [Bacteroidales bacterium]
MKYPLLLIQILFVLVALPVNAQKSAKLKEIHQDADYFFEREDYSEAITQYMLLLDNGYESANIKFKIGVCYLNMPGEEVRSIPYFEEASRNITIKYKPKELEETHAPLHTLFFLGNAYRINNELSKALEAYDKFTNNPGFFGNYNLDIVDTEVKACERAKTIQDKPVEVNWLNLGDPVNTSTSETCPVVSGNDSVLVYLSTQKLYNAIFFCKRQADGTWSSPDNLNPQVLSDGEFYPSGLSFDGRELYLIKKASVNSDIYVSEYADGRWSRAKKLNENVNSSSSENYASVSPDGKTLYFTSNRSNSRGGYDIYFSVKGPNGEWGKAQNMGKVINTPQDEATPFMASDNKTLYFSSKGHYNMGGFDVFYTTINTDK